MLQDGSDIGPTELEALRHSWSYLTFHSDQRYILFRFFLLIYAALAAAFAQAYFALHWHLMPIPCILGMFATIVFWLANQRTLELANIGRDAMAELEGRIAKRIGIEAFKMADRARKTPSYLIKRITFMNNFTPLYAIGVALASLSALWSISQIEVRVCRPLYAHKSTIIASAGKAAGNHTNPLASGYTILSDGALCDSLEAARGSKFGPLNFFVAYVGAEIGSLGSK